MDEDDPRDRFPTEAERLAADRASRAAWDPIPGEPADDYRRFREYLTHTSTDKVSRFAEAFGYNPGTMGALAHRWQWKARRAAYEGVLRAEHDREAVRTARDLGADLARSWARIHELATEAIEDAFARGQKFTLPQAVQAAKIATEQQRLAAGESTSRVEVVDVSGLTPEELEDLADLAAKIPDVH